MIFNKLQKFPTEHERVHSSIAKYEKIKAEMDGAADALRIFSEKGMPFTADYTLKSAFPMCTHDDALQDWPKFGPRNRTTAVQQ